MATKKAVTSNKKSIAATKTTVKTVSASSRGGVSNHLQSAIQSPKLWKALAAEFIGTFLLASVIIVGQGQPIFVLFGLVGIVLLIGAISGAHVNPAITIGAWATRRIGWLRALGYIVVQFLGAAIAFFTLSWFVGGAAAVSQEAAAYGQAAPTLFAAVDITTLIGKEWYVFFAEILGVAILALAVATAGRNTERLGAAFTVGLGIFVALMVTLTVTGFVGGSAIINPAVAVALQAYTWQWVPFVVYAAAPIIGGVLGFVIHDVLNGRPQKTAE